MCRLKLELSRECRNASHEYHPSPLPDPRGPSQGRGDVRSGRSFSNKRKNRAIIIRNVKKESRSACAGPQMTCPSRLFKNPYIVLPRNRKKVMIPDRRLRSSIRFPGGTPRSPVSCLCVLNPNHRSGDDVVVVAVGSMMVRLMQVRLGSFAGDPTRSALMMVDIVATIGELFHVTLAECDCPPVLNLVLELLYFSL